MKKLTLTCVWCLATAFHFAYGQNNEDYKENYFLRDYKAPDFMVQTLDVSLAGNGVGSILTDEQVFSQLGDVGYSLTKNSQRYQGILLASLNSRLNINKTTNGNIMLAANTLFNYMQNRFYFKNEWFVGGHNLMRISSNQNYFNGDNNAGSRGMLFQPAVSIGNGRMEPVHYARNAMDIERALRNGDRLSRPYTIKELQIVADQITRTNNVRFYDFRLRRITQFEELDKALQSIGNVTEADIAYFAHMADAFLYAKNFRRFSGFRNEFGITQYINNFNNLFNDFSTRNLGSYAFYQVSYDLPESYAWQHSASLSVMGGLSSSDFSDVTINTTPIWVNGEYGIGYYPNTRTHLQLTAGLGAFTDLNNNGGAASLTLANEFYITPQLRFDISGRLTYGDNYRQNGYNFLLNDMAVIQGYNFNYRFSLRYAIF